MVDKKVLEMSGITAGDYKRIFTASKLPKKTAKLVEIISSRMQQVRRMNIRDFRMWWAIDLAHEVPFKQTTPTIIGEFLSRKWTTADDALKALESWGLSEKELFIKTTTPDGKECKVLNPPVFYQILVPIVKAYSTIRLAKIFNERDTSPLFPFNPCKNTIENRVLCDVVTDISNTIATALGYSAELREAIQQMLKYGISLSFPREVWYKEKQDHWDDETEKAKTVTTKEGLRHVFPHPSRMGYDLNYSLSTFNTNSGCSWALYWHVMPYGDILDGTYWNRENIFFGTNWMSGPDAQMYFREAFPCTMEFPSFDEGTGKMDRENRAAYYTGTAHRDKAVFVTEFFMNLIPSKWGLGRYADSNLKELDATYNKPVWHRFVMAGDDTVLYCEPIAYVPNWFMGYDYDPQMGRTSSLSLELIPWQDQVGNQLSQLILTCKQNMANVTFFDKNIIDPTAIDKLEKSGNSRYTGMNFIPIDSMRMQRQGLSADKALFPMSLEKQQIQEQFQMLNTTLNIMERVLQITAQEAGSAASHQQSKAEIVQTGGASSNRLAFTSSFVDDAIDAWKRQIFESYQAYGDGSITAEIAHPTMSQDEFAKVLAKLGLEVQSTVIGDKKVIVTGKKKSLNALRLESFARSNEGPQSLKNPELAQQISLAVAAISASPLLSQAVGAKTILKLMESVVEIGSGIRGTTFQAQDQNATGIPQDIIDAIQKAQQATLQAVEQKIAIPLAQANAAEDKEIEQLKQTVAQLEGIYKIAEASQQKTVIKQQEAQASIELSAQKAAEEEKRKNSAAAAERLRKDQLAQAEIVRQNELTRAELQRTNEAHRLELQQQAEASHLQNQIAAHESVAKTEIAKTAAANKPKPAKKA